MKLAPREFAWSYIQRSGRVDPAAQEDVSPIRRWQIGPLFPTTLVGSYPAGVADRPKKLAGRFPRVRARRACALPGSRKRRMTRPCWRFARKRRASTSSPTARSGAYFNRFATALEGVDIDNPGTALDRSGIRTRCRGSSARSGAGTRWKWRISFSKKNTGKPVKMTVPGPSPCRQQAQNDYYKSEEEAAMDYAAAVNAEIKDFLPPAPTSCRSTSRTCRRGRKGRASTA